MNFKIVAIIIAVFIIASCQRQAEENTHDHSMPSTHEEHSHANVLNHKFNITLNDGEKWMANMETTEGIKSMMNLVNEHPSDTSISDCGLVKEKLTTEYALIIEKCTMTGKAHEQLHNFLVPLSNYINEIPADGSCEEQLELIKSHLLQYSNYFI